MKDLRLEPGYEWNPRRPKFPEFPISDKPSSPPLPGILSPKELSRKLAQEAAERKARFDEMMAGPEW